MSVSRRCTRLRAASVAAVGATLLLGQVSASAVSSGGAPATSPVPTVATPARAISPTTSTYTPGAATSSVGAHAVSSSAGSRAASATPDVTADAVTAPTGKIRAAVPSGVTWGSPIAQPSGSATTTTTPTSTASSTPPAYPGWRADWVDNLSVPITSTQWGRYGWNNEAPGQGAMGVWSPSNVFTSNGVMTLRTQYANGVWTSGGVSSGSLYSASGGRWEFRAKFPVSKGIQYAFLLYPSDGTWPPEIDIAEGRVNGPQVMGAYHYDADNKQSLVFFDNPDMSGWHTYGVIVGASTITYTFDGRPWATVTNPNVTTKKLWIGFQCSPMDPNGSAQAYETIDNGVPGPLTPAISDIQIDWVAHYVTA